MSDRLPYWTHVFGLIIYILLFLLAVLGNSIALWILRAKPELRTLTHAFLTNLVVADLLLALLTPLEAVSIFSRSYMLGDAGCKLQRTLLYFFYAASIMTLSAISVERFVAICLPLSYDVFKERKRKILGCIWLVSVLIVVPHLYLGEERTLNDDTVCFQFHTADDTRVAFFWGYTVPCFVLLYLAPLTIISITYWRAAQKLSEMEQRLEINSQCDLSIAVRMRKDVLRMLLVVLALFVVQWTPFEIVEMLVTAPNATDTTPLSSRRVAVNMLAFSNAVLNPVAYGFMSKPFREGFKEAWLYLIKLACCSGAGGSSLCKCTCWNNCCLGLPFIFKAKNNSNAISSTDLTECRSTSCDIDWDSSFSKLGNPVSIIENELHFGFGTDLDKPDCPADGWV